MKKMRIYSSDDDGKGVKRKNATTEATNLEKAIVAMEILGVIAGCWTARTYGENVGIGIWIGSAVLGTLSYCLASRTKRT